MSTPMVWPQFSERCRTMLDRYGNWSRRPVGLHPVPPAPEVLTYLVHEYHKNWKDLGFSFRQFLVATGYQIPPIIWRAWMTTSWEYSATAK